MDLMNIRRGLISSMGKNVLDNVVQIVETFTFDEDAVNITFPSHGTGTYFIVSDPPMTFERASESPYSRNAQAYAFTIRNNKAIYSLPILTLGQNNNDDYWGQAPQWVDEEKTILMQSAPSTSHFMAGYTYYLLFIPA